MLELSAKMEHLQVLGFNLYPRELEAGGPPISLAPLAGSKP